MESIEVRWRGGFASREANALHAAAFGGPVYPDQEWDWVALVDAHSLGWVTARVGDELVGFANVLWDGFVHAWLQDVMVTPARQRSGIGVALVELATVVGELRRCLCVRAVGPRAVRTAGASAWSGGLAHRDQQLGDLEGEVE